jgi:hypothetical protein
VQRGCESDSDSAAHRWSDSNRLILNCEHLLIQVLTVTGLEGLTSRQLESFRSIRFSFCTQENGALSFSLKKPRANSVQMVGQLILRLDLPVSGVAIPLEGRPNGPTLCSAKPNTAANDIHLAEKYFPTTLFSAGQRSQQRSVHRRGRDIANRQVPRSTRNHRTLSDAATLLAANNQP